MLDGEATKMSKQERRKLRNIVIFSGLGGAVLGLAGYYTVGPGYAELQENHQQAKNQPTVSFQLPSSSPFESVESR